MADDQKERPERIWLEAFQESQRQMASAHAAYQEAMTRSHEAFMHAIAESQSQLAAVLEGKLSPEEFELLIDGGLKTPDIESEMPPSGRAVRTAVLREAPGFPLPGLEGAIVIRDPVGVGDALAAELGRRGIAVKVVENVSSVPREARCVISLAGIVDFGTVENALEVVREAALLSERISGLSHGTLVLAYDTGGRFGLDICEAVKAPSAGLYGLARVLDDAWPEGVVKSIDLDVGYRKPEEVAAQLADEMLRGGTESVGLAEDARFVVEDMPTPAALSSPFSFGGVALVSVSATPESLAVIRSMDAWPEARLVLVGQADDRGAVEEVLAGRDHVWIDLETGDVIGFLEAVDVARREFGVFGAIVHANIGGQEGIERLDDVLARRISLFQVILAATAADPVRRIGVITQRRGSVACEVADEMLRKIALAEKQRRGDECLVKALSVQGAGAMSEIWRELGAESDEVEIILGE